MTFWLVLGFAVWTVAILTFGIAVGAVMVKVGVQTDRERSEAIIAKQYAALEYAGKTLGELVEDQEAAIEMLNALAVGVDHH